MTVLIAWVVFPLVLGLLSLGCGLLAERAAGVVVPVPLVLPLGFAVVSLAGQFAILGSSTAQLATPLVVTLAAVGIGLSIPLRRRLHGWWLVAAVGVFMVFAAPFVLSGGATFGGYIKLDDTATYLAMLDRAMQHGYQTSGLPPSTYEATLNTSLAYGYPLGSVLPLGIGRTLVRQDAAWLWQPYLTFLAALLACGLYQLVAGLVESPRLRALVAFVGAQAALLYGYALWGGVKELAVGVLVVLSAALVPQTAVERRGVRSVLSLSVASAALLGVLSLAGAVWLVPSIVAVLLLAARANGWRHGVRASILLAVATATLAIPSFVVAGSWLSRSGGFTSASELGNLVRRLSWLQVFGIWPNGDFRTPPQSIDVVHVLVVVVGGAALLALVLALRRRAWELPIGLGAAAFACAVYVGAGSPWIAGKALASASPIVLAAALAGAAAVFETGRRVEATVVAGVLVVGVIWSNVLQYHDLDLAPRSRLMELAAIGHRFAGQGPTLMTEFESYGVRHFLRAMDAEAASELRRHPVYLRAGGIADTGVSPDIDELALGSVLPYRTLVLRRSGVASRPPSVYVPVWSGRYYQVWQRPITASSIIEHVPLGSRLQPAAVPRCSEVMRLARLAGAKNGFVAAVERDPAIVIETDGSPGPPLSFGAYGEDAKALYLTKPYSASADFAVHTPAIYGVWVGGSFKAGVEVWVDGLRVGGRRDQLNWPDTFSALGSVRLGPGRHTLRFRYDGPDLRPGSGGTPPFGVGPLALSSATGDSPITYVRPADARSLCGKSLDWVEALRG